MAPELITSSYTDKVDIYRFIGNSPRDRVCSLGIVAFEIFLAQSVAKPNLQRSLTSSFRKVFDQQKTYVLFRKKRSPGNSEKI